MSLRGLRGRAKRRLLQAGGRSPPALNIPARIFPRAAPTRDPACRPFPPTPPPALSPAHPFSPRIAAAARGCLAVPGMTFTLCGPRRPFLHRVGKRIRVPHVPAKKSSRVGRWRSPMSTRAHRPRTGELSPSRAPQSCRPCGVRPLTPEARAATLRSENALPRPRKSGVSRHAYAGFRPRKHMNAQRIQLFSLPSYGKCFLYALQRSYLRSPCRCNRIAL